MSAAAPASPETSVRPLLQIWADSMAQVLAQIGGRPFAVEYAEAAPEDALPPQDSDLNVVLTCDGKLRGEMSLRLPQAAVLGMAQLFLGETPDPGAGLSADHREAVEELLRQIAGHAATAIKPGWGETQLRLEFGAAPSWPAGASGWLQSAAGAAFRLWLEWQVSAALLAVLRSATQEQKDAAAPASPPGPGGGPADATAPADRMGLFLDVELEAVLRFGGRRMLLREILELNGGSVIELDRQVQEPVDLLLDGRLIARGEVVVVDGNYGLRVLEVISAASAVRPGREA
jgi:flagellar motor switch protein FliN